MVQGGFSSYTVNLYTEADGLIGVYVLTVSQRRQLTFGSGPFPPSHVINSLETDGGAGRTEHRHHSFINLLTRHLHYVCPHVFSLCTAVQTCDTEDQVLHPLLHFSVTCGKVAAPEVVLGVKTPS